MKFSGLIFLFLFFPLILFGEEKNVEKNFKVVPNQHVFINGVSGIDVKVIGWDKNEAAIKIKAKVNSSDSRFETEYLQSFDVNYKISGNDVYIDFAETDKKGSWSVFDIFKGDLKYSFSKEITGEIYLPGNVLLTGNFKYSDIYVTGIEGALVLDGKGNHFTIKECSKVNVINNEYGNVTVSKSKGNLSADLKLSPIKIEDFEGDVKINAQSLELNLFKITGNLYLNVYDIKGLVEEISKYVTAYSNVSNITFKKVNGVLEIHDKTSELYVYDASGFKLEGSNTHLTAQGITGVEKNKVFLTTNYGKYRISNSSGVYYIDDNHSDFIMSDITGNIFYSAKSSSFSGKELKGDWKSDTKYAEITLRTISANKIEAIGVGKTFKADIANNPQKVDLKNQDGDIDLFVNPDIKTSVFLTAIDGNLFTDFSIHKYREGQAAKAAERLNGGGAVLSAEVKNASISLKKRGNKAD